MGPKSSRRSRIARADPRKALSGDASEGDFPRRFHVSEFIRIGLWRASVRVDWVCGPPRQESAD